MESIERTPIREQAYQQVLQGILQGTYPPGMRLRDTALAVAMSISRTPVRETLLRLEQEGFLANRMGRGFSVRPLDRGELQELYPILWTLESLALATTPPAAADQLERLETLNLSLLAARREPRELIERDQAWHAELISLSPNQRLRTMIAQLRTRVRRYEYAYMQVPLRVTESGADHRAIQQSLAAGNLPQAAALLQEHWHRSLNALAGEASRAETDGE